MKYFIVLSVLVVLAVTSDVPIVSQHQEIHEDGKFHYKYETGDGVINDVNGEGNNIQGSYRYTAPDGTPVEVNYVADENGYRPTGEHIPQIPSDILRSLEYLRAHPPADK